MSLEVKNLSFSYGDHQVLSGIDFETRPGELVAVLGPNGVGKSTLFRCMLGLLKHYTGQVFLEGDSIRHISPTAMARRIAYVPQSHYPSFNYSVFDMVLMGTTSQLGSLSTPGEHQACLAEEAMERLGITHLRTRGYKQISGGERQLVLIARALAQQAKLLIMDEPTANLDYGNQMRVLTQVKELASAGYSVIQSTHSPDHAFLFADRVLAIKDGKIIACGPPAQVLTSELLHALYDIQVEVHQSERGVYSCLPLMAGSLNGIAEKAE